MQKEFTRDALKQIKANEVSSLDSDSMLMQPLVGRIGRARIIEQMFDVGESIPKKFIYSAVAMLDQYFRLSQHRLSSTEAFKVGIMCLKLVAEESSEVPDSFLKELMKMPNVRISGAQKLEE